MEKDRNLRIKKYCKKLWLNEGNIIYKLNKIIQQKQELLSVSNDSYNLLIEIGFYEIKIEDYFNNYFLH